MWLLLHAESEGAGPGRGHRPQQQPCLICHPCPAAGVPVALPDGAGPELAAAVVLAAYPPRGIIRFLNPQHTLGERPLIERIVSGLASVVLRLQRHVALGEAGVLRAVCRRQVAGPAERARQAYRALCDQELSGECAHVAAASPMLSSPPALAAARAAAGALV